MDYTELESYVDVQNLLFIHRSKVKAKVYLHIPNRGLKPLSLLAFEHLAIAVCASQRPP